MYFELLDVAQTVFWTVAIAGSLWVMVIAPVTAWLLDRFVPDLRRPVVVISDEDWERYDANDGYFVEEDLVVIDWAGEVPVWRGR